MEGEAVAEVRNRLANAAIYPDRLILCDFAQDFCAADQLVPGLICSPVRIKGVR